MNKVLKRNIKERLKELPSVKQLCKDAIKGKTKKGWYNRANKQIKKYYGTDIKEFTALLAATSPRQTVEKNLEMTKQMFSLWEFFDKKRDDETLELIASESDLEARKQNVKRALTGKKLSGNKVSAFNANLQGDLKPVTIDTWMITYAGIANKQKLQNKAGYIAYSHRIKKAAKRLGWKPAEIQECIWSYTYAKVNKCRILDVPEFKI